MKDFLTKVKEMRQAQKGYEKNKWHPTKGKLSQAKAKKLESEVDKMIIDNEFNQGNLF